MTNSKQQEGSEEQGSKTLRGNEKITQSKQKKAKKYNVKIDDKKLTFDSQMVTGKELLVESGYIPVECFTLYQKLRGGDFEKISLNEKVDLGAPGREKFTVKDAEVYHYTVDSEPETTEEESLTGNQILKLAGLTPITDYYLVEMAADGTEVSYQGKMDIEITMSCPGKKFISVFNGPTTTS